MAAPGTLYVVATPIGNMEDLTPRARRVLGEADIVAAEDTRVARKLLGLAGITNKTVSNHKFNERQQAEQLLAALGAGQSVALVSDAGTPCVSDPGGVLVGLAAARGIPVVGVGGVSAVAVALSVSGFTFDGFAFYGFLPRSASDIKKTLAALSQGVSVFFESPRRIQKTLAVFAADAPDAALCLCNDLTKLHERIYRGAPREVLAQLAANPAADKGEYTLVARIDTPPTPPPQAEALSPEAMLVDYMTRHNATVKDAVAALTRLHKNKKAWYAAALRLRGLFSERP